MKAKEPLRQIFDNFALGTVTRMPPERIDVTALADSQNISFNDKYLPTKSKGQIKNGAALASDVTRGGCVYKATNGTKYWVVACGGKIYYSVAGSRSWTAYQVTVNGSAVDMTINSSNDVEFAQYNGRLFVVNGAYPVITNDNSNDHQYTTSRMIKITDTTVVGLTVSDIPSGLQFIWVNKERMFGLNSIAQGSGLFWTNAYFDYSTNSEANWTPVSGLNYDYVGKDDGESGTGLFPYQNSMFVFKNKNVYNYSTVGDITNWGSIRVDTNYGCAFNRTIKEMDGYLYWLSMEGIVRSDGTNVDIIDDNIRPDILKLPQLKSNSRQWSIGNTADFNAGTVGDTTDTTDNELKQKKIENFGDGTYGALLISASKGNLSLIPQEVAADWNAGTQNQTIVSGDTVILDTVSIPSQVSVTKNIALNKPCVASPIRTLGSYSGRVSGNPSDIVDGNNNSAWAPYVDMAFYVNEQDNWVYVDLGSVQNITEIQLRVKSQYAGLIVIPFLLQGSNDATNWTTIQTYTPPNMGICDYDLVTNVNYRYFRFYQVWAETIASYGVFGYVGDCAVYEMRLFQTTTTTVYTNQIYSNGTFVTQTLDYGFTPIDLGHLCANYTANNGTSISFATRTSADGSTWDSWVAVNNGDSIGSTPRRYIQVQANFFGTQNQYSPILNSIFISAPFISKVIDYGFTPDTFGTFLTAFSREIAPDYSLLYTRSSADNNTWSSWELVSSGTIASTPARYFQWQIIMAPEQGGLNSPILTAVYFASQWRSAIENLGAAPAVWGNFDASYLLNGQTITWWLRSASSSGGITSATFVQQTPGTPVTGVTLNQYIQVEVRITSTDPTELPIMEGFKVTTYTSTPILKPCAYVFNKEYGLNVADEGQSINNIVWRYIVHRQYLSSNFVNTTGFFLKRTNKYNNFYVVDEQDLWSGTSQSDGYVRINETGYDDDGVAIDSWFITKNAEQGVYENIFKRYVVGYKSDQSWTFSYSTDNGKTWTDITIPVSSNNQTLIKTLSGLVLGHFIQLKCEQALTDANWQVSEIGYEYDQGYEIRND